jgi:flavin-binding protein dodecin
MNFYFISKKIFYIYKNITIKLLNMAVLKVIEVLSSSAVIWEDATKKAVAQATKSLKNIRSVYVQEQSASVKNGQVEEFRVNLKLTFEIE